MKILAEVFSQSVAIGYYPRLHASGHQEYLIVMGVRWSLPPIALSEMVPSPVYVGNRGLAVDQQCDVF